MSDNVLFRDGAIEYYRQSNDIPMMARLQSCPEDATEYQIEPGITLVRVSEKRPRYGYDYRLRAQHGVWAQRFGGDDLELARAGIARVRARFAEYPELASGKPEPVTARPLVFSHALHDVIIEANGLHLGSFDVAVESWWSLTYSEQVTNALKNTDAGPQFVKISEGYVLIDINELYSKIVFAITGSSDSDVPRAFRWTIYDPDVAGFVTWWNTEVAPHHRALLVQRYAEELFDSPNVDDAF